MKKIVCILILLIAGNCPASFTSNLVGWWKLNEQSGTSIADSAGSNTGTWVGTELVTNGDFAAWSGVADPDNEPNNWDVVITGGAVEPTRKLVNATNKCQLITEGNLVEISQTILTVGKTYVISINVTDVTDGNFGISINGGTTLLESISSTGTKTYTAVAENPNLRIKRDGATGAVNVTFTNVSVREVVDSRTGVVNRALLFDGADPGDDVITVSADPSIDAFGKTQLSIATWINPASDGENDTGRVVDKTAAGTAGYFIAVGDEAANEVSLRVVVFHDGVADTSSKIDTGVSLNIWTHIAFVYNEDAAKKGKIYVNGIAQSLDTDIAGAGTIDNDSSNDLIIGNRDNTGDNDRTFDGLIDNVMIFDKALTANEVKHLYNSGRGIEKFGQRRSRGRYSGIPLRSRYNIN